MDNAEKNIFSFKEREKQIKLKLILEAVLLRLSLAQPLLHSQQVKVSINIWDAIAAEQLQKWYKADGVEINSIFQAALPVESMHSHCSVFPDI